MSDMWFGTFHHSEFIDCPVVGSEMSPRSWGSGGEFLSGGGWQVEAPDAHKEFSLSWSGASAVSAANRLQAYRDGAYSKTAGDLFYFHDPLSYAVNVLPKRWAQPSLMARTGAPWAPNEVPGPGVRNLPLTGAHIVAGTTDPLGPGPGVLFVPIPVGKYLGLGANTVSASPNGLFYRVVNTNGTVMPPMRMNADNTQGIGNPTGAIRGILLYFKGTFDVFGIRAIIYSSSFNDLPSDFPSVTWVWHAGMGHSGCRFTAPPTYVPTDGLFGGRASFAATLKEVGDWLQ